MIPELTPDGALPPGIHWATWDEFSSRYGTTPHRQRLLQGMKLGIDVLKHAGCHTVYVDGSFITSKLNPGDFDACWDPIDVDPYVLLQIEPSLLLDLAPPRQAQKLRFLGEFFISDSAANPAGDTYLDFFQHDRDGNPKGIVAIDLGAI